MLDWLKKSGFTLIITTILSALAAGFGAWISISKTVQSLDMRVSVTEKEIRAVNAEGSIWAQLKSERLEGNTTRINESLIQLKQSDNLTRESLRKLEIDVAVILNTLKGMEHESKKN